MCIHMPISCLFRYVKMHPVVLSNVYVVTCWMSYLRDSVCVPGGPKFVLRAGFSLCDVVGFGLCYVGI